MSNIQYNVNCVCICNYCDCFVIDTRYMKKVFLTSFECASTKTLVKIHKRWGDGQTKSIVITYLGKEVYPQCASLTRGINREDSCHSVFKPVLLKITHNKKKKKKKKGFIMCQKIFSCKDKSYG